jgi:hypothetical protein
MDVSGRVLRAWMPAIHAGMTGTADGPSKILGWTSIFIFSARA